MIVTTTQKALKKLLLIATFFSLIVIALGAYTRLVHAGLGCPDWPLCYGHAWAPSTGNDIAEANLQFPKIPVNLAKTWPEMTHRYLAASLGALCIAIVFLGWRVRRQAMNFPIKHSVFLLGFVILQGLFGMWTVTLKLWPQVVTLHLLGGFTTLCLLLLLYLRSFPTNNVFSNITQRSVDQLRPSLSLKVLAIISLIIVAFQIALGGWTTSNYAALACVDLPWCDVSAVTSKDVLTGFNIFQEIGPNYLGGQLDGGARVAIHLGHRFGALLATVSIISLILLLIKYRFKWIALLLGGILTTQIMLGLSNIYFYLPLSNAVAHNVVGALLVASIVFTNWVVIKERAL